MHGLFGLNGLTGYFLAVFILLAVVVIFGYKAIMIQAQEADNPYKIENANALHMKSAENAEHYKDAKAK